MDEGRNAIYLASLGWSVSGFDPADAAVALAQERAKKLALKLTTAAVRDSQYEFGKEVSVGFRLAQVVYRVGIAL